MTCTTWLTIAGMALRMVYGWLEEKYGRLHLTISVNNGRFTADIRLLDPEAPCQVVLAAGGEARQFSEALFQATQRLEKYNQ